MTTTTGSGFGRSLLPHHRRLLREQSAVAPEVIAERGYFSAETRKELKTAFGSDRYTDHLPGLVIPVYNVHGQLAWNHVRFDEPPIRDGKACKYLIPYRAHGVVDVPRRVLPHLGNPRVPLWVTEGSRKVDALVSAGVAAIGLTGVWSWRGTNEHGGKTLLADFESIAFNDGREIHIVFDSDVMWKDGVRLSLERFRAVARRVGGDVILHYLPAELPNATVPAKVGVDDFLAAGGTIADLMHFATRELLKPPSEHPPGMGGGPEPRATVQHPPQLAFAGDIPARLVAAMRQLGHVGEEIATTLIYLAITSRLLQKIVSVAVKGPSGAGKSATVDRVLRFVPDDAVISLTGMSEHYLAYDTRPINHKILLLYEASGFSGENATYLIRTLLSEGVIRHGTVESTPDGLNAREVVREGPAGLITTTTQVSLHPENETRLLSITVDDSAEQTKKVILAVAGNSPASEPPDLDAWHTLQHWLEDGPCDVTIPFSVHVAELIPPIAVRLRRDVGTLLALVRAHALLHRATRELDDQGRVVATLADYGAARELVANIISDTLGRSVSPATREAVEAVAELTAAPAAGPVAKHVSYAQLSERLGIDKSSVSRRARVAIAGGYLRNEEDKRGKPARIVLGDPLPDDVVVLPTVAEVADRCSVAPHSEPPPPRTVRADFNGEVPQYTDTEATEPAGGKPPDPAGQLFNPRPAMFDPED